MSTLFLLLQINSGGRSLCLCYKSISRLTLSLPVTIFLSALYSAKCTDPDQTALLVQCSSLIKAHIVYFHEKIH